MLFLGPPGSGKTTLAYIISRARFGDNYKRSMIEINASDDRGIAVVRNKIKILSQIKGERIIFLDEADALTDEAMDALRRIMETTQSSQFILSANHEYKIIEPIRSRCVLFRFRRLSPELVVKRLVEICLSEGLTFPESPEEQTKVRDGFNLLVQDCRGDLRKAINSIEKLIGKNKSISPKDFSDLLKSSAITEAIKTALSGDFESAKTLIEDVIIQASPDQIIDDFRTSIENLDGGTATRDVKIRLLSKLSDLDYRLKIGSTPLVQVVGFLAFVWLSPHLPEVYPLGTKE